MPEPIPLASLAVGATVFIGHTTFEIVRVAFDRRFDGVEWWTRSIPPLSRDYVNLWLASLQQSLPSMETRARSGTTSRSIVTGWAYVDRSTGEAFLHGLWE